MILPFDKNHIPKYMALHGKLCPIKSHPDNDEWGIYQKRRTLKGIKTIKMKLYAPPETAKRLANPYRLKFANAVTSWHALTDEQKSVFDRDPHLRHMSGFNLYIKKYMKDLI
jgi:hypothetical protein